MAENKLYTMKFNKVYPALIAKAERKGYTGDDVDRLTSWLTGYKRPKISAALAEGSDISYGEFFEKMPSPNPNRALIHGSICGVKIDEIEDPVMKDIRRLDKMVDELVKGKSMEKILREPKDVDEYISLWSPEVQDRLNRIRVMIQGEIPDAREVISWKMPTYKRRHNLIHFAVSKKHIGIYPGAEAVEYFSERLTAEGYKFSKGAIQLPMNRELPETLIREIAAYCRDHE